MMKSISYGKIWHKRDKICVFQDVAEYVVHIWKKLNLDVVAYSDGMPA